MFFFLNLIECTQDIVKEIKQFFSFYFFILQLKKQMTFHF